MTLQELNEMIRKETDKQFFSKLKELKEQLIEAKMVELFGVPNITTYFNKLIEAKKGIEPDKLNALKDYIQALTKIEFQASKDAGIITIEASSDPTQP